MRMRSAFVVSLVVGLGAIAPAAAQSVGERTGVNSALGISPTTADFVKEVASSDMFEIASSELASQRADDPAKSFASQMIEDHRKTTSELKAMLSDGRVNETAPTATLGPHEKKVQTLRGLQGKEFTRQYLSDQVSAHKDAISLFQRYAKGGDNEQLKAWAAKTVPALEHHLQMAQKLYDGQS